MVALSATPTRVRSAAPVLGADGGEVLAAAGYAPEEIAALREAGVAG